MGGVTTSLNYLRTGHYYLNRGGPYCEFMPEVYKQRRPCRLLLRYPGNRPPSCWGEKNEIAN
jgi:hypothetical protein